MHQETISVAAIAPTTGAAGVILAGDSFTVKNGRGRQRIIAAWARRQVAGFSQITFPSAHDTTRGFRSGLGIGMSLTMALGTSIPVNAQELLTSTIAGSAVGGDLEQDCFSILYDDVPGMDARNITPSQLESRFEKLTTIEASIVSTAGPSYGTPEALNADSDLLQANRDYAVLGATCRTQCMQVYLVGPDTSNVRISVPGFADKHELCSQWFVLQSRAQGVGLIPVISSGNKTSTLIGVTTDENAGTFLVTLYLALLK